MTRPDPAPRRSGDRPRVLALRALGLGDLLAAVPALRALRRAFPRHEIVLAAPEDLTAPARASGAVDTLLPASAPGRAVPERIDWHGPPPDVAVDLHGNGPPSHLLLERLRPGRLLAFAHPGTPHIEGPPWHRDEHERDRWCRLLAHYGIPGDPGDLLLAPPARRSPAPGAVLLHPGAGAPSRCWPAERHAAVATALRDAGRRVVVTGGPGERDLVARVAEQAGIPGADRFTEPSFDLLAALVAEASAVVSGDTGIAHLAFAQATGSVTLFGPLPPRLWGPPPGRRHRALWYPGPPGDPGARTPDPHLMRITPDDVLAALAALPGAPAGRGTERCHV